MASHIISGTTSLVLLLGFLLLSPEGIGTRLDACDPVADAAALVQGIGDTSSDLPDGNLHSLTVLQLLQTIDAHPQHMVILPSGKSIVDHQLETQNAKQLHVFDLEHWRSPIMAMKMLKALGWELDVVKAPFERTASPIKSSRLRSRTSSRAIDRNEIKVVFAYPPVSIAEDPFQSIVIELKNASLDDTFKALREMRSWWARDRFDVVATPSTNSIVLFASEPVLIERCKVLIDQMEQVAERQQGK